ncbi:MAG: MauE/DoxX family redox-associated membrane protein [Bacteroidota bacterium]
MQTIIRSRLPEVIANLFLILLVYTATAKFLTIQKFASTLSKSPLIGSMSVQIAWIIPAAEILISLMLIINATRKKGLYASFFLMVIFTAYLLYMVLSESKLPCSCGGMISTLSWQQHIWFNLVFVFLAALGIRLYKD